MPSSPNSKLRVSPSGASRWTKCKASPGFIVANASRLPKDDSEYATEGTDAHNLASKLLMGKKAECADKDMLAHVEGYVAYVKRRKDETPGGKLFVEQRLPNFYGEGDGTTDVGLVWTSKLIVIDLKYGEGVSVEAIRNEQLAIYARNLIKHHKLKLDPDCKVELVIYQPRAQDDRFVRVWVLTVAELVEFTEDIASVACEIMLDPDNQPFAPSDKACQFCKAKKICTARAGQLVSELPSEAEQAMAIAELGDDMLSAQAVEFPKVKTLTPEQIGKIVAVKAGLEKWLDDVKEYALELHNAGQPVPGTKMVAGRPGNRKWAVPDEEVFDVLKRFVDRTQLYERTFISPSRAEELLKKPRKAITTRFTNRFSELLTRSEGQPTVVPDSDPRPALEHALSMLGDETLSQEDQSLL